MNRARIPVSEYEQLAKQFNPVKFDAEAWVRLAQDAGMKYIVITSQAPRRLRAVPLEGEQVQRRRRDALRSATS